MGCLACKSCVGQCPIKVDVPEFRAKFLELYYSRYLRPIKDYFVGSLEYMTPILALFPKPYNWLIRNKVTNRLMSKVIGLEDSPALSDLNLKREMSRRGIRLATPLAIESLSPKDRKRNKKKMRREKWKKTSQKEKEKYEVTETCWKPCSKLARHQAS